LQPQPIPKQEMPPTQEASTDAFGFLLSPDD